MSLLVALAALMPACVLDTKLVDNLDITDSAASETSTTTPVTGGDESTAPTTDSTDTDADACTPPDTAFEWVIVTNADDTWLQPIDETCKITSSQIIPGAFKLRLDCPVHSALHGELELGLVGGPMPDPLPFSGQFLDVYYQPYVVGSTDAPHPEMLFLHSGGELLYAATRGFFLDPNDAAVAAVHYAPLTVDVEPGPCPLADNPYADQPPPEGWTSDGFTCKQDALAEVHFGSGEGTPLVLGQFMSGPIAAGPITYTASVLSARRGTQCPDVDLEKFFLAIARQSAP